MSSATLADPVPARLDLTAFLQQQHRLPRLGDAVCPWHYRGWLLAYVIELHALIPAVADRWGYHLRILEARKLLDEPIPQIAFGPPDARVFAHLQDWSRLIGYDCGGWSDFRTLLDWLSWGLALADEAPPLSDAVNEKLYRQVNVGSLLARPYDYLGEHVASSKARGWNPTGFYPTPHNVVECMVRMMIHDATAEDDDRDPRLRSVCDPCVGSGRMLLHASNHSLCVYGQDIDPLAVAMCKINGALYAPWLVFPLPASILDPHDSSSSALAVAPAGAPLDFDSQRQRSGTELVVSFLTATEWRPSCRSPRKLRAPGRAVRWSLPTAWAWTAPPCSLSSPIETSGPT